jgi:hypothetical protein
VLVKFFVAQPKDRAAIRALAVMSKLAQSENAGPIGMAARLLPHSHGFLDRITPKYNSS